jgi:hypothetical protein
MSAYAPTPKPAPICRKLELAWWLELYVWLALICAMAAKAEVRFESIDRSTNRPSSPFSAAGGSTGYFDSTGRCHSVTFTISGDPGIYDLLWDYDLDQSGGFSNGIVRHPFLTVDPPITNLTGLVTVTYPARTNSPAGFYRLKRR